MARIAILAHCHFPICEPFAGGLEAHTALTARLLSQMGHQVTLFAKEGSVVDGCEIFPMVPHSFVFTSPNETVFGERRPVAQLRSAFRRAMRFISRGDFDFVINNSLNGVPLEWPAAVPTLTIFHTPVILGIVNSARIAGRNALHAFATVSSSNRKDWERFLDEIEVIPNGIQLDKWLFHDEKTEELRWSARITPEKGLHLAIGAAKTTGRVLRIAGPISNKDYFESMIRPLLGREAIYEGHLNHSDLNKFLSSGIAAISSPMWEEPFGLSVVEAFASGTPVAALRRGAMADLVISSVGSLTDDVKGFSLADAIGVATTKSSVDCRRHAEEYFDAQRMIDRYLATLELLSLVEKPHKFCSA